MREAPDKFGIFSGIAEERRLPFSGLPFFRRRLGHGRAATLTETAIGEALTFTAARTKHDLRGDDNSKVKERQIKSLRSVADAEGYYGGIGRPRSCGTPADPSALYPSALYQSAHLGRYIRFEVKISRASRR